MDLDQRKRLRPLARQRAEERAAEMAATAAAGGNITQKGIDLQDIDDEFALTLPEGDREVFWQLYAQEIDATTQAILVETAEINLKVAEQNVETANNANAVAIILGIVAIVLIFAFAAK